MDRKPETRVVRVIVNRPAPRRSLNMAAHKIPHWQPSR